MFLVYDKKIWRKKYKTTCSQAPIKQRWEELITHLQCGNIHGLVT